MKEIIQITTQEKDRQTEIKNLQGKLKKIQGENLQLTEQVQSLQDQNENIKSETALALKQQRSESMRVVEKLEEECKNRIKERDELEI